MFFFSTSFQNNELTALVFLLFCIGELASQFLMKAAALSNFIYFFVSWKIIFFWLLERGIPSVALHIAFFCQPTW